MNDADSIPDDVRRFVLASIPSVAYLEAILIFREKSDVGITSHELSQALYIELQVAEPLLQALCDAGVVAEENGLFRYAPKDALRQAIDKLAIAYPVHLLAITKLIHSTTEQVAHQFASAFKWRKEK